MLKSKDIELSGRDAGQVVRVTELPALVADRLARAALKSIDAEPDGGVAALALRHLGDFRKMGKAGLAVLQQFVQYDGPAPRLRDWHNIERIQHAALALHVGFLVEREALQVPVAMRAAQILDKAPDIQVTFCSPFIAAVLDSQRATYRELETVLSTEDAYNIVEIINVRAVQDWHANQAKP